MPIGSGVTQEQEELRSLAREFAAQELAPGAPARDERGELDVGALRQLAEVGFLGLRTAEEFGGLGLDHVTWAAIIEELAKADAGLALAVVAQTGPFTELVALLGSPDQQSALLPGLANGAHVGAIGMGDPVGTPGPVGRLSSGPGAGAPVVRGVQRWVVNGTGADLVLLVAESGEDVGPPRLIVADVTADGLSILSEDGALGLRSAGVSSAIADQVEGTPEGVLSGDPSDIAQALDVAQSVARLGVAAVAQGIGEAAIGHAGAYSMERKQFGKAIGEFGAIRDKFARVAVALAGARTLIADAAARLDASVGVGRAIAPDDAVATMVAKISASDAACLAADESVQVFGGYGYMRHYPVERSMRDAKVTQLIGGTNATLREIVAGQVLESVTRGG